MRKDTVKSIKITRHAMQRLIERVGSHQGYASWGSLVQNARYNGKTPLNMTDKEYAWYLSRVRNRYQSSQIRMMGGFAFFFKGNHGHARTLVTVIKLPNFLEEKTASEYLEGNEQMCKS